MSIELNTSNIGNTGDKLSLSSMDALQISCPCFESALNAVEKKKIPIQLFIFALQNKNYPGGFRIGIYNFERSRLFYLDQEFVEKEFLTGIDATQVEEYLNKGAISEDLSNIFLTNKDFQLSTNATTNNEFLFSWSNVHINSERLRWFLEDYFEIGWAKDAKILIFDPSKTIRIFEDEKLVEIMINEKKEKAILKISDGRTLDLKVKKENGKLNIYKNDKWIITDRRHSYIVRKEKGKLNIYEKCEDKDRNKKIVNVLSEYKNQVIMNLKDQNLSKAEAEKIGMELFNTLIPSEIITRLRNKLKNKSSKVEWWVWIYCDFDDFNPLWEWLYTASSNDTAPETSNVEHQKNQDENTPHSRKSPSNFSKKVQNWKNKFSQRFKRQPPIENNEEDGFFWGDRFFLARVVPGECEIQEESVFEIDKVAVLRQKSGCIYSKANATYIDNLCIRKSKEIIDISLNDYKALSELVNNSDRVDYILHVAAGKRFIRSDRVHPVLDILTKLNKKPLLLFLNICECDPTVRSEFINSIPTKTWIDTSSGVAENIVSSCKFAEFFYEEFFDKGKNVVVAATEARKGIRDRRDLDDSHKLWRLAYVVNGNPYIKIT